MFHLVNTIRGNPSSPSLERDVADYCGVFDAASGKYDPHPPRVDGAASPPSPSPLTPVPFKAYFDHAQSSSPAASSCFKEQHVSIKELNARYASWRKVDLDDDQATQHDTKSNAAGTGTLDGVRKHSSSFASSSSPPAVLRPSSRRPIRVVHISDTHQYHDSLRIPEGDVLICSGDVLMSDRLNPDHISTIYLQRFLMWLASHRHGAIILIGGNHDCLLSKLTESEIKQICGPRIKFLFASEVVDCFGVRLFGNSYSFGTSGNVYGQDEKTLAALREAKPHQMNIVDGVALSGCNRNSNGNSATTAAAAAAATVPSTVVAAPPITFPPRKDPRRAIDILVTHSCMNWNKPDDVAIVQRLNPVVHCVGHHHEDAGLSRGVPRTVSRFTTSVAENISTAACCAAFSSAPSSEFLWQPHKTIPQINGAIAAEIGPRKWNPALHPPKVFDVWPVRE